MTSVAPAALLKVAISAVEVPELVSWPGALDEVQFDPKLQLPVVFDPQVAFAAWAPVATKSTIEKMPEYLRHFFPEFFKESEVKQLGRFFINYITGG